MPPNNDTTEDAVDDTTENEVEGIQVNLDSRKQTLGMIIHLLDRISESQEETNALLRQLVHNED